MCIVQPESKILKRKALRAIIFLFAHKTILELQHSSVNLSQIKVLKCLLRVIF